MAFRGDDHKGQTPAWGLYRHDAPGDWATTGACATTTTSMTDDDHASEALAVCARCATLAACREWQHAQLPSARAYGAVGGQWWGQSGQDHGRTVRLMTPPTLAAPMLTASDGRTQWGSLTTTIDPATLAALYRVAATPKPVDHAETWLPCASCVAAGGWDAGNTTPDGLRCWPNQTHTHGRPQQHFAWTHAKTEGFIQAGRGTGKTRSAAEDRLALAARYPNTVWYAIGATAGDTRDFCFEGDSGLVTVAQRRGWVTDRAKAYNRSLGSLELRLDNGSVIYGKSGQEPDRLRGPNAHGAWVDEPGSIAAAANVEKQLHMLVRARFPDGHPTTILWSGTPSRTPFMRELVDRAKQGLLVWQRGHTLDNAANLDPAFVARLQQYEGTEWGRQELEGLLLTSVEGALWDEATIERMRCDMWPTSPAPLRALVCVDPAASESEVRDEAGIITILAGPDKRGYAVADNTRRGLPHQWAETVLDECARWDPPITAAGAVIVLETNYAKAWMMLSLREAMRKRGRIWPIVEVHATEGKRTRAEPVAALCAGPNPLIRIVGVLPKLEDELTSWVTGDASPNRLDAFVWGAQHLFGLVTARASESGKAPPRATAGMRTRAM